VVFVSCVFDYMCFVSALDLGGSLAIAYVRVSCARHFSPAVENDFCGTPLCLELYTPQYVPVFSSIFGRPGERN
jgi:hypothetical protein